MATIEETVRYEHQVNILAEPPKWYSLLCFLQRQPRGTKISHILRKTGIAGTTKYVEVFKRKGWVEVEKVKNYKLCEITKKGCKVIDKYTDFMLEVQQ